MSVEKMVLNQLPESVIGFTTSWLSNTDLYNLSVTSKDIKQILELADKDVYLSPYYSARYMNDHYFKNKINDILKKRNTNLNLNFGFENDLKTFPNLSSVHKLIELNLGEIYYNIPKNLEKVLPPNLQKLKLSCSLGTDFPAFPDLSSLNKLIDLDLYGEMKSYVLLRSNNIIEFLPLNLEKLKLSGFYFQTFPDLSALVKLIELDLGKNELTSPDDNNLGKLFPQNLRVLRLGSSFGMTTFPDLTCLDKLVELDLNDNFPIFTWTEMSTIPDPRNIGKLLPINLEKLDLRNCRLKTFPDLSALVKLIDLDLGKNELTSPDDNNVGKLFPQNLRVLRLGSAYGMETFPDLSCLDKLVELDLNDNFPIFQWTPLTNIPDPINIGKLLPINLEKLDLRNCGLKTFPNLKMLNKLVEIDLTDNDINIPENMEDLLPPSMDFEE